MSDAPPTAGSKNLRRFLIASVLIALGFNLWALTRYWNENLRDAFESRQYQTALTAFYFQQNGLKLAYETPVLGPPWSIPMEFPLYQAVVAKLSTATGLPLEQTGRLTSILAFFACFPALWLLLKTRLPFSEDWLVIVALALLSPMFLFYSRTVLIESTALCVSLWFLAAFDAALRLPSGWRVGIAWAFGALAAATKITTFAVFCPPAMAIAAAHAWQRRRSGLTWLRAISRPLSVAAIIASVPVAAGIGWVVYSDHLKELNPYGRILTSSSLREFNFGPLALRFTWKFWQTIAYSSFQHVITVPALVLASVGLFFVAPAYRRVALVCAGCYCFGFLTFANLYYVHDYYYYASAFLLLVAVGSTAAGLLRSKGLRHGIALAAVASALVSEPLAFFLSYGGFYLRPNPPAPAMAEVIKETTKPNDVFAALDFDWNPMIPYCAERRAIMVFQSHAEDRETFGKSLANLKPEKVGALLVGEPHRRYASFLLPWLNELEMETQPIASTPEGDLYVRQDLFLTVAARLDRRKFPGVTLHLPKNLFGAHDLTQDTWPQRLTMASPSPHLSRGEFAIGLVNLAGDQVISAQAPTEILIRPSAGAKRIQVRCGMMPGAYQNGNTTDGVVVEIREELPDGTIRRVFRRELRPLDHQEDRQEVVVDYAQETPFQGILVFGCYPGPSGSNAFDWVYWRSIDVR
jgi:hypothetical protein